VARADARKQHAAWRANRSASTREASKTRRRKQRADRSDSEKDKRRAKQRKAMADLRARKKAAPRAADAPRSRKGSAIVARHRGRSRNPRLDARRVAEAEKRARNVARSLGRRRLCGYCRAPMWKSEGTMCCLRGRHVARPQPRPPKELLRWEGDQAKDPWSWRPSTDHLSWDERSEEPAGRKFAGLYREDGYSLASRRMNNHFAFTSIGCDVGKKSEESEKAAKAKKKAAGKGPLGFVRLAGRVYHFIPASGSEHDRVPFYVHDILPSEVKTGDRAWLDTIRDVLHRTHPLARTLRAARTVEAQRVHVIPDPAKPTPKCPTELAARYRIVTDIDEHPQRSFVIFSREGGEVWYPTLNHELYESLQYPTLLPHGTYGWYQHQGADRYRDVNGQPMSLMWYARQRMLCDPVLHACGRVFNEWLVDMFCRIDDERLNYFRLPSVQDKMRIAEKGDILHYCEAIEADHGTPVDKPGRVYLPSTHSGSKRQMYRLLQNACAASIRRGKATLFDTMTCNPGWPEIKDSLLPGQTYLDRPDLCARVFKRRLEDVLAAIQTGKWHIRWKRKMDTSGREATCLQSEELEDVRVVWRVYVIEYQQRGLPHAHIVYRLEALDGTQPRLAEEIDRLVQARYPDKVPGTNEFAEEDQAYVELINRHMVHRCGRKCRPRGWNKPRCKHGYPFPI